MTTLAWEGSCIRHTAHKFVGVHVGYTRLASLMERPGDLRGVRVQLPDGTIKIASEYNLEIVEPAEYEKYATKIGVELKGRKTLTMPVRS